MARRASNAHGVAAWLGGSLPMQLLIGGVFAVAGTVVAHQWRKRHAMPTQQAGLDASEVLTADRTSSVQRD